MRRRILSVVITALVAGSVLCAVPALSAQPPPDPAPPGDSFFVPPSPLPEGKPGDVIRWRPSKSGPLGTPPAAWQVMYLSTNALGERTAMTGTVIVPRGADPAKAPLVGFAPGTQGPAFKCRPSNMIDRHAFYEQPALNDLLNSGYAVAVPDYEGYRPEPKATYVTGRAEGHALLDVVRAAQRLPQSGISPSAKVMLRGYSQGGGASMWAGQLQPEYAAELDLIGIVAGGVPADLTEVALYLEGKRGFGLLLFALLGLDNAYPDLDLGPSLNDAGRAAVNAMNADECTLDLLLKYENKRLRDYLTSSPLVDPEWLARVGENKLGGTPPRVPVYQYHGEQDDLVQFGQAAALRSAYCAQGVKLTWKAYQSDHITLVYTGNADALAFMRDRVAGVPAGSNC
ncbi:lipase family protein [Amycolatopsis suaedae]|uniref:Lipase n=1 Tax=Amycolatopsis suaedae TaxID=2510978 RepID=A0A4Q7JD21_9PSEU|nr:lipase family protein [Amycolatopsis suaedae]RZQ65801.1 lipase [Amycolatopsis suaedae]